MPTKVIYIDGIMYVSHFTTEGNDKLTGSNLNDIAYGYGGNDVFDFKGGNNKIHGGKGNDTAKTGSGNDKLYGDAGNDKLYAGAGNDLLSGGSGNDQLFGGKGNDKLDGGKGNDLLSGGAGSDTFIFKKGQGNDTITDFEAGCDKGDVIRLDKSVLKNFSDVLAHATEKGDDLVIDYGRNTIKLEGIDKADLHANDFFFF